MGDTRSNTSQYILILFFFFLFFFLLAKVPMYICEEKMKTALHSMKMISLTFSSLVFSLFAYRTQ